MTFDEICQAKWNISSSNYTDYMELDNLGYGNIVNNQKFGGESD